MDYYSAAVLPDLDGRLSSCSAWRAQVRHSMAAPTVVLPSEYLNHLSHHGSAKLAERCSVLRDSHPARGNVPTGFGDSQVLLQCLRPFLNR